MRLEHISKVAIECIGPGGARTLSARPILRLESLFDVVEEGERDSIAKVLFAHAKVCDAVAHGNVEHVTAEENKTYMTTAISPHHITVYDGIVMKFFK